MHVPALIIHLRAIGLLIPLLSLYLTLHAQLTATGKTVQAAISADDL